MIFAMICSTRHAMIRCSFYRATRRVSSRILVPIKGNSQRDIFSSPNALAQEREFSSSSVELFISITGLLNYSSPFTGIKDGTQDQANRLFFTGDCRRGPEGRFLCAGCRFPRYNAF